METIELKDALRDNISVVEELMGNPLCSKESTNFLQTNPGIYSILGVINEKDNPTPTGLACFGILIVFKGGTYLKQFYIDSNSGIYIRNYNSNGTFSPWRTILYEK